MLGKPSREAMRLASWSVMISIIAHKPESFENLQTGASPVCEHRAGRRRI